MAKIFVAIPQYRAMPEAEVGRIAKELHMDDYEPYFKGFHPMFDISMQALCLSGHTIRHCNVYGDGNLPRVRSFQAGIWKKEWDEGKGCDYLFLVDEDVSFTPEAIDILIKDDKPIIGGIYSLKAKSGPFMGKLATTLLPSETSSLDGPFKVRWLNGGFVLIKAEALLKLFDVYKNLEFDIWEDSPLGINKAWGLWLPMIYRGNGDRHFLSEDYAFCQRATEAGFDIWSDWRVKVTHWSAENGYTFTVKDPVSGIPLPESINIPGEYNGENKSNLSA